MNFTIIAVTNQKNRGIFSIPKSKIDLSAVEKFIKVPVSRVGIFDYAVVKKERWVQYGHGIMIIKL